MSKRPRFHPALCCAPLAVILAMFAAGCGDDPGSTITGPGAGTGTTPPEFTWHRIDQFPSGFPLVDVHCFDRDHFIAVGLRGAVVEYKDGAWSRPYIGKRLDLWSVWGSSPDEYFIAGDNGLLLQYADGYWSNSPIVTQEDLRGIWGSSADSVYAVGDGGVALFYNHHWSLMDTPDTQPLFDVWGSSGNDVYAVGAGGVRHFDGAAWRKIPVPTNSLLSSITGTGPDCVYAVGARGTAIEFDGTQWIANSTGTPDVLQAAWAPSCGDLFAAGENNRVYRYDGSDWELDRPPVDDWFYGIAGTGPDHAVAVGAETVVEFDGQGWSRLSAGGFVKLRDIWAATPDDVFAVGDGGTILRFRHGEWRTVESSVRSDLTAVWGDGDGYVYIAGGNRIHRFDGTRWLAFDLYSTAVILDVWGIPGGRTYATSIEGRVYYRDDTSWFNSTLGSGPANAIWGVHPNELYVACDGGDIYRYNGSSWRSSRTGTNADFHGVWGVPDDFLPVGTHRVFAVGEGGLIVELQPESGEWEAVTSPTASDFHGLTGAGSGRLYAVGDGGTAVLFNGSGWATVYTGTGAPLLGACGLGSGELYAAGGDGPFSGFVIRHGPD